MNVAGITLNAVCLGFLIFLLLLYFTKKNMNNLENKIYRCLLIDDLCLVVSELLFLFTSYFIPKNLFLIGLVKRFNFFFIVLFFVIIGIYILVICFENNKKAVEFFKRHERNTFKVVLFIVFVIAIFQFYLPIEYFYNKEGVILYAAGFCTNDFATIIGVLTISVVVPCIIMNWKISDKKKLSPFIIVSVLEIITLIVTMIDPSLCMAAFSITMTCYLMFFTIENPDLKMITELTLAKTQAERANNAKTDFLSSMSHELRTPLNAIVGLSEMIRKSNNIDDIHTDNDDIITASQSLLELVEGILDINKLEANKMEIMETNYNPRAAFEDLSRLITIRLGKKPIEFKCHFTDSLPEELYGDKEKIKQVITNLATNAIKYTDSGSIEFNVDCENKDKKCILKISIIDTGRGIKDDQKEFLFTKFYRLSEDKDSNIGGTGLGLVLTKSIVDLMKGKITVDSKYGEGSNFTVEIPQRIVEKVPEVSSDDLQKFTKVESAIKEIAAPVPEKVEEKVPEVNTALETEINTVVQEVIQSAPTVESAPVAPAPVAENTAPAVENTDDGKQKILLVVDDNKLNLRVASKLLEEFNFEIETANSGAECLEKVKADNKYALVFMDIMMPDMGGVETMHKLKDMETFTAPVIALTADAMDGSREKYMGEGFDEYVSKPINKVILEETLNKCIALANGKK